VTFAALEDAASVGSWNPEHPRGGARGVGPVDVPRVAAGEGRWPTAALNAWLGIFLVAFGLHNFPLAAPAALNLAYQFRARRAVGWAILTVAIAANLALFTGSLVFLASGQSFEQFSGM
jgi:uncharacterized membrane protein